MDKCLPIGHKPNSLTTVAVFKTSERGQFRELLEQRRNELLRVARRISHEGRQIGMDEPHDSADFSTLHASKELLFQQNSQNRRLLSLIEAALRRIGEGSFGTCANCSEPIESARLHVLPWAQFCRGCQESFERNQVL